MRQNDNRTQEMAIDVRRMLGYFLLLANLFSAPGIDQVSMETQTKTRAREISSQKRWKEKARRAKQPRLSGSRQRAILNRADKRTRTSETQVMPKIRRAPTKAATNRRRTKSRARTAHVSQVGSLAWSLFYDANYIYCIAQSVIYTGLFFSVPPDFQYRNEKLVAAN